MANYDTKIWQTDLTSKLNENDMNMVKEFISNR